MIKRNHISIYTPLGSGGPDTWGRELTGELCKRGLAADQYKTLPRYLLEPVDNSKIIHSSLPFFLPTIGKYVLTLHGDFNVEKNIWSGLYPSAIKVADVITVPSNYLKEKLKIENVQIVPNGIQRPSKTKDNYKIQDEIVKLGIMTNFNFPEKADGVVSLAKAIKDVSPNAELVIAGDGVYIEKYRKALASINIRHSFLGFVKKESFFDKIDVFTYYSYLDTFGLSLLEAMSYGLPVMSNAAGGLTEIMVGPCKNYLAKNENDYKDKLKSLIDSEQLRRQNGKAARERAQFFYWENIIDQWIKIYNL